MQQADIGQHEAHRDAQRAAGQHLGVPLDAAADRQQHHAEDHNRGQRDPGVHRDLGQFLKNLHKKRLSSLIVERALLSGIKKPCSAI